MTKKEAYSWLMQPGIQLTLGKYDRQSHEAINIAAKELRKQVAIPYKVKYKETVHVEIDTPEDVDVFTFHCPCCDNEMGDTDWDGHPTSDWQSYCGDCGQKIDWAHDVDFPEVTDRKFSKGVKVGEIYTNDCEVSDEQ